MTDTCGPFQLDNVLLGTVTIGELEIFPSPHVQPFFNALSPAEGSVAGGTVVSVYGKNFSTVSTVLVDGSSVSFSSDTSNPDFTKITFTTSAHLSSHGSVDVTITTDRGEVIKEQGFKYLCAVPVVTSVAASTGPHAGGTAVTITGTGFTFATEVYFGDTHATSLVVVSSTSITCTTPPFTAADYAVSNPVSVIVKNPDFDNGVPTPGAFTYVFATPNITSISPSSGDVLGGMDVVIAGTGFLGIDFVSVSSSCPFNVISDTKIIARPPTSTITTAEDVFISNPSHDSGSSGNGLWTFTYPTPVIYFVEDIFGGAAGGEEVFISGNNLYGVSGITFGGTSATAVIALSDRLIRCVTPAHTSGLVNVVASTPTTNSGTSGNGKYTYT